MTFYLLINVLHANKIIKEEKYFYLIPVLIELHMLS